MLSLFCSGIEEKAALQHQSVKYLNTHTRTHKCARKDRHNNTRSPKSVHFSHFNWLLLSCICSSPHPLWQVEGIQDLGRRAELAKTRESLTHGVSPTHLLRGSAAVPRGAREGEWHVCTVYTTCSQAKPRTRDERKTRAGKQAGAHKTRVHKVILFHSRHTDARKAAFAPHRPPQRQIRALWCAVVAFLHGRAMRRLSSRLKQWPLWPRTNFCKHSQRRDTPLTQHQHNPVASLHRSVAELEGHDLVIKRKESNLYYETIWK